MTSETISQIVGILWFVTVSYLGARTVASRRKKDKASGSGSGNVFVDTATKLVGALTQDNDSDDGMSEKREDALEAMMVITDVLKETRATLVATRVERDDLRKELIASRASRDGDAKLRGELSSQVTLLRADVTRLQHEANEREENHRVELARSRAEIAELTETNERQRETIAQLQAYVQQLLPLLKRAGIATDELPVLPPPLDNGNGKTTGEHKKADDSA